MTTTPKVAKTAEAAPTDGADVLDKMAREMGIIVVPVENVPPAPRQNDRDDARWDFLTTYMPKNQVGEWLKVKEFAKAGSAGIAASNINNGKNKKFPESHYEARYEKNSENNTSVLYLRYKG